MQKKQLKLIFIGTPEFSAKILSGLLDDGYGVIGVVSEPDKPTGRKQEVIETPVKKLALEKGLKVFQPEKKSDILEAVEELDPDLMVVVAYGKILPKEVLENPKYGCINFHASLLPQLRGASPVQTAILQGLEKTGITVMKMDEGMDTGPILSQAETEIDKNETSTTLREKILETGLPLLIKTIPEYIDGKIKPVQQDESKATYCKLITKEDGKIDFSKSATDEERKLRAYDVWPGGYAFWQGKRVKFLEVGLVAEAVVNQESRIMNYELGKIFLDEKNNLCVAFAKGYWVINKLQLEGKKEMDSKEFLNGYGGIVGMVLS